MSGLATERGLDPSAGVGSDRRDLGQDRLDVDPQLGGEALEIHGARGPLAAGDLDPDGFLFA